MPIEKLPEFAKDGQKNTNDLTLLGGFPVGKKPARQWFNWLFNTLTTKINEIIDADFMPKSDVVDNLTTNDAAKPISAKQAKLLQDNKLDKTANAVSATKLQTARTINGVAFDGSANINLPTASTSTSGTVQLNDTLTSTSTTQALTAAQGRALQVGKLGKTENAVSATNCSRSILAGNGLSGGGELNDNRTITLGTPSTVTASTTNSTTSTSHTHNIDVNSLPLLGVGQAWQDVTSTRGSGVTYINNTGRPIQVAIRLTVAGIRRSAKITIGGVLVGEIGNEEQHDTAKTMTFIIPTGANYIVNGAFSAWAELR